MNEYTKHDCILSLIQAKQELGYVPTRDEYRELDIYPSASKISDTWGTWSEAINVAGFNMSDVKVSMQVDTEWMNLSRKRQRRLRRREWYRRYKQRLSCEKCPESRVRALQFHHKDDYVKKENVSDMAKRGYSKKKILKEMNKCKVLCANCHAVEHKNG